jgi:hypothetical protein
VVSKNIFGPNAGGIISFYTAQRKLWRAFRKLLGTLIELSVDFPKSSKKFILLRKISIFITF